MRAAEAAESATAVKDGLCVESNMTSGVDWRNRVPNAPPDARSLGTSESWNDGVQRGQAHGETEEEAWYQLDHTRRQPDGLDDPAESQR